MGADPEHITIKGDRKVLSLAAERGHRSCMEVLFRFKALVDSPGSDGATPLMCAAHCEEAAAIECLLKHQADVNAADGDGWNALMYASNSSRSLPADDDDDDRHGNRAASSGLSRN